LKSIACYSMKGGVGKTATAVNIAYWSAKTGNKTLLIDLDPQGASSFYFRVKPTQKSFAKRFFDAYQDFLGQIRESDYENLDVLPASLGYRNFDSLLGSMQKRKTRLKKILKGLSSEYKLVVIDCPPSIGYLSEAVFNAADLFLVPVIPTTLSERTFDQLHDFFKANDYPAKRILPFFSMVQRSKSLHHTTIHTMRKRYKRFLDVVIPFATDVEKMGEYRAPVDCFARTCPANIAYFELWKELVPKIRRA